MREITGFRVIDHGLRIFGPANRGLVRAVTEVSRSSPESLDMPSTSLRLENDSLHRPSRDVPRRRRSATRFGALTALLAFGLAEPAIAAPELHVVVFRPSPSPNVAGYVLHLGTESGDYAQQVDLGQPSEFDNLLAYATNIETSVDVYVALSSYDSNGLESPLSNEYQLGAAPVAPPPGETPAPDPTPDPEPAPEPDPGTEPTIDPGSGTTLPAVHAMANLGVTSDEAGLISMVRGDGTTFDLTIDSLAASRDLRPTRCDLDGDGDSDLVLGFGSGSDGQVALIHLENGIVASVESVIAGDAAYHAADGQTYPACGDVDGDGRNELVIGMGPDADAALAVFDSADTRFAPFDGQVGGIVRAPIPGGLGSAGTGCVPALGDFDGDGRDELVVGFTAGGHRSIAILDDGLSDFGRHVSLEGGNGLVQVAHRGDDGNQNGGTYPALGDWDGDGLAEFAVGYGQGGGSWMVFLDDGVNSRLDRYDGFLHVRVGREDARAANLAVRPSFGDIDADGRDEIVVSFGSRGTHELHVFEDMNSGSTNLFRGGAGFVDAGDEAVRWMAAPAR